MKCNLEKMNEFFKNNQDEDVKKFIVKLLEEYSNNQYDNYYVSFLQLGFFEVEAKDEINEFDEDLFVIDFMTILNLEDRLKKFILKGIEDNSDSIILHSVLMPYRNWEKINRKNKLMNLSKEKA